MHLWNMAGADAKRQAMQIFVKAFVGINRNKFAGFLINGKLQICLEQSSFENKEPPESFEKSSSTLGIG